MCWWWWLEILGTTVESLTLWEQHEDFGFRHIELSVFNMSKRTLQYTMGMVEVNLLRRPPLPHRV